MLGFGSMLKEYLEYYKISQSEFADRLEISKKHMNEILNDKAKLSVELMIAISLITDIDVNLIAALEEEKEEANNLYSKYKDNKGIKEYLKNFYINDLNKNNWIQLRDVNSPVRVFIDFKRYIGLKDVNNYSDFLKTQFSFKKNDPQINMKTFLFITHCNHLIKDIKVPAYSSSNLNKLLNEIKEERVKKFNKDNLINIFNKYGIILVIEEPLKGTKLRGCARVKINTPVIYLTTMYKNKSSLYFTLYHEIGHIKRDYNALKNKTYEIDDEKNIDNYALSQMIDDKLYEDMQKLSNKEIITTCKKNKIPLSFYYSRLAYEKKISYKSKEYLDNMEKIDLLK